MAVNLEFDEIKSHFASCKLASYSRSKYHRYEWSFIMANEDFWYRMAERALARHDLERCASICFQWLSSFAEAFDNDAFSYKDDRFVFRSVLEWFSDMILKVYDDDQVTDELRLVIIDKYDKLNRLRKFYDYGLLDINGLIDSRGWPIEVIDFDALYKAERKAKEEKQLAIKKRKEEEKRLKYIEEHFVCDYTQPSERFKCQRVLYPLFKRDSANLAKRIMPKMRKIYNKQFTHGSKEGLMQQLDGHVRAAHLQAVKGEIETASLINDSTIQLINDIRQDEKFHSWIGDDTEVLNELNKILSNALTLKEYCQSKQKPNE